MKAFSQVQTLQLYAQTSHCYAAKQAGSSTCSCLLVMHGRYLRAFCSTLSPHQARVYSREGLIVLKAGKAGLTCWTAKEQLMPAPFRVLPCSYRRRTDGPIPCTCHLMSCLLSSFWWEGYRTVVHSFHGCCSKLNHAAADAWC